MTPSGHTQRIDAAAVMNYCADALKRIGVSVEKARLLAQILTTNDLRGVGTHGTACLHDYIRHARGGGIDVGSEPSVIRDGPAFALTDGNAGFGVLTSHWAMKLAVQKAEQSGVAFVTVRNSAHFAAAGYFANMAVEKNMIGLAMSNANPVMAITGTYGRTIGNNPIAFAVPGPDGGAVHMDVALSAAAGLKVRAYGKMGQEVPLGWVLNSSGEPSTNPADYINGGALVPVGEHKGYGFAVLVECLTAALSGAAIMNEVHDWTTDHTQPGNQGHSFLALDVSQFVPFPEFEKRIAALISKIKSAPLRPGVKEAYLPGELETIAEEENRRTGLQLHPNALQSLHGIARDLGMQAELNAMLNRPTRL